MVVPNIPFLRAKSVLREIRNYLDREEDDYWLKQVDEQKKKLDQASSPQTNAEPSAAGASAAKNEIAPAAQESVWLKFRARETFEEYQAALFCEPFK